MITVTGIKAPSIGFGMLLESPTEVFAMSKSACGQHTEISSNNAVRVTRCTCGTIHVTLHGSGVTVRMPLEAFRGVSAGLGVAIEKLDTPPAISATGSTSIN